MKFIKCLIAVVIMFSSATFAVAGPAFDAKLSYYVSAEGNNGNNGLSEQTAFKTLTKAVESASKGAIKRVTVIGTLDSESELAGSETATAKDSVFSIVDSGDTEITITGQKGKTAVLQGGDGRRVISILGDCNIRFENILITGGDTTNDGGGIYANGFARILLAQGAIISGNKSKSMGGGVWFQDGGLIMHDNSKIINNYAEGGGGGIYINMSVGLFSHRSEIIGNKTDGKGGGVYSNANVVFVLENAKIADNICGDDGGGIYGSESIIYLQDFAKLMDNEALCGGGFCIETKSSAFISDNVLVAGNRAFGPQGGGGICAGIESEIFMSGGKVVKNYSSRGGGVYIQSGTFTFRDGFISKNVADSGGGIYEIYGRLFIHDESKIVDNRSDNIYSRSGAFEHL